MEPQTMSEITQSFHSKLAATQTQLTALWSRVGVSADSQQTKWRSFVTESLEPFLDNFKLLCYSEEKQLLAANDEALRDLVALATNLKMPPRHALLVDVVSAATNYRGEAQCDLSLGVIEQTCSKLPSFAEIHATDAPQEKAVSESVDDTAVRNAFRRLCAALPSHQEVHQLLTSELKHLNAVASIRLAMLRLLHKQRALLQLPPAEQVAMRNAYADKYITQCNPITVWAAPEEGEGSVDARSAPAQRTSSQFGSARSADSAEECAEETKADLNELQLLLTASLYNEVNSTRDTSFCLQPRPTCASATPVKGHVVEPAEPPIGKKDASSPSRASLFEPDLSDIDRYGKRQDLSMSRIRREAADILREVEQQNEVMEREAESDIQCIEAAVAQWPGTSEMQLSRSAAVSQMKEEVSRLKAAFTQSLVAAKRHDLGILGEGSRHGSTQLGGEDVVLAEALPSSAVAAQCAVPACLRQLLATSSYAPIRACVSRCRDTVVHQIMKEHRDRTRACYETVSEVLCRYASVVATPVPASAHSQPSDESTVGGMPSTLVRQYEAAMAAAGAARSEGNESGNSASASPAESAITTVSELQQVVDGLNKVCDALTRTGDVLQQRLNLLEQGAALLAKREAILEEKRSMQEGSRERLLSKKVNMAKVLLHEENVRRRMAKDLPAAVRQLTALAEEWEQLNESGEASGVSCAGPFVIRGVDVADVLRKHTDAHGEGAARHASISSRPLAAHAVDTSQSTTPRGVKRQRTCSPLAQPRSQRSVSARSTRVSPPPAPLTAQRRLASPALRPRTANSVGRHIEGKKHSVSPTPRGGGSPVPSVFQRLHSASASRATKKDG